MILAGAIFLLAVCYAILQVMAIGNLAAPSTYRGGFGYPSTTLIVGAILALLVLLAHGLAS